MTTTLSTQLTDAIDDLRFAADDNGDPVEGATVIWPSNADALHLDAEGVMLSAHIPGDCCCGHTHRFVAERVEGEFRDGELWVSSTWSRQAGCGEWPEIVTLAVPADQIDRLDEAMTSLRRLRDERIAEKVADVTERLTAELRAVLDADPDDRDPTGSETAPGVYIDGGQWVAWDYRPGAWGEVITVTASDVETA